MATTREVSVASTIVDEHKRIVALLQELEKAREYKPLSHCVRELGELLGPHFAREEGEGGFFEEVLEERPEFEHKLKLLHRAHEGMLKTLADLDSAVSEVGRKLDEIDQAKTDLIMRLRSHEAVERKLISDVYMQDDGLGD